MRAPELGRCCALPLLHIFYAALACLERFHLLTDHPSCPAPRSALCPAAAGDWL
jgi:hypothetical protein